MYTHKFIHLLFLKKSLHPHIITTDKHTNKQKSFHEILFLSIKKFLIFLFFKFIFFYFFYFFIFCSFWVAVEYSLLIFQFITKIIITFFYFMYLFMYFTVKILKFGTPQTIAIIVLKLVKFDVTLHKCIQKKLMQWQTA